MADKKFSFTIAAEYAGSAELKKLQSDLKELGKIDSAEKLRQTWQKTNDEFVKAKDKMRLLRAEMKAPGGAGLVVGYAAAKDEVNKLSTSLNKQKAALETQTAALKKSGLQTADLAGEQKKLQTSIDAATRKQKESAKVMAAAATLGVRPFSKVKADIASVNRAYETLKNSAKLSGREQAVAFDRMKIKIRELKREMNGWTGHLEKMQEGWAGLLGVAAAVAGGGRVIGMFANFDDTMRQVGAVSGATAEEFTRLRESAAEMGRTTRFSASQAAEGMRFLSMAGFDADKAIASLPNVLQLASAGAVELGQAADIVTNIMSGFQIESESLANVNDVLVKAFTSSNSTLVELGAAFSYVGPIAKSAGQSFESTVAILAKLHDAGIKGERAGTALRGSMARLSRPTRMVKDAIAELGLEVKGTNGKMRPFIDILADLEEKGADTEQIIKLFGQEAGPGMAALLGLGTDALKEYEGSLHNVEGTSRKIAEQMEDGIGGAFRKFKSAAEGLGLVLGESVAPAIVVVAEGLTALTSVLAATPAPILHMVVAAGLAVTGLVAWKLGLSLLVSALRLSVVEMGLWSLAAVRTAATANIAAKGFWTLKRALGVLGAVLIAFDIGWHIGKWLNQFDVVKRAGIAMAAGLTKAFLKIKQGWAWVSGGDTDAIQRELETADRIYGEMFASVGREADAAGVKVKKVHSTAATAAAASAAQQKQVTAEAMQSMKDELDSFEKAAEKAYSKAISESDRYANQVKVLEDKIVSLRSSSADKVRAMGRKTMTDERAWTDKRAQAQEKLSKATTLAAKGGTENMKQAESLFKGAQDLYASLQGEIKGTGKEKDKVVKTLKETTKVAVSGYNLANKGLEALYQKQQAAAQKSSKDWKQIAADIKKELDLLVAEREANVEITVDNLDDIEKKLEKLARDRDITLKIREVETRATGGPVGFRTGGRLPGYGGGDKISALLEAGEFVIRKEAVSKFGSGIFHALNSLRLPDIPKFATGGAVSAGAVSPQSMGHYTHDINFPGSTTPVRVTTDQQNAESLLLAMQRMGSLAA